MEKVVEKGLVAMQTPANLNKQINQSIDQISPIIDFRKPSFLKKRFLSNQSAQKRMTFPHPFQLESLAHFFFLLKSKLSSKMVISLEGEKWKKQWQKHLRKLKIRGNDLIKS